MTDPNSATSRFLATITMDEDRQPVLGISTGTLASRVYTVYGKVTLADSVWIKVNNNAELYRFFKVTVDLK